MAEESAERRKSKLEMVFHERCPEQLSRETCMCGPRTSPRSERTAYRSPSTSKMVCMLVQHYDPRNSAKDHPVLRRTSRWWVYAVRANAINAYAFSDLHLMEAFDMASGGNSRSAASCIIPHRAVSSSLHLASISSLDVPLTMIG